MFLKRFYRKSEEKSLKAAGAETPGTKPGRKLYIYSPGENALAYRLEYRGDVGYVFRGWARGYSYRLEGGRVYKGAEDEPTYIIIEEKLCRAGDGSPVYAFDEKGMYSDDRKREVLYIFRRSIEVQGTI